MRISLFPDHPRLTLELMKTANHRHTDHLGWVQTNLKNQECFYFHDPSQTSAIVCNHSRHMKTQIRTVVYIGDSFSFLPILWITLLEFPTSANSRIWDRHLAISWYLSKIWDGQEIVKCSGPCSIVLTLWSFSLLLSTGSPLSGKGSGSVKCVGVMYYAFINFLFSLLPWADIKGCNP